MTLHDAFLELARGCVSLGSPFMGRLMTLLAGHWPNDTALAQRFAQWEGDVGPSGANLPLRLAGGLHALVLMGRDVELAAAYPPNVVDDHVLRDAVSGALKRHDTFLCGWAENAPQTNEVRRSAVLIAAAHWLDARYHLPMCVSELGASAGLNLIFDKYAMQIGDEHWGPDDATVRLTPEWRGALPPHAAPRIEERRGVDLNPLHVGQAADELRLISYLWADQTDRIVRTRAAMALQDQVVEKSDAVEWLSQRLSEPKPGRLHLIYHTIAWQYFPPERQARGRAMIEAAGALATEEAPLAWFAMEADDNPDGAALTLRLWPGDVRLSLGRAGFHGQWVAGLAVDFSALPQLFLTLFLMAWQCTLWALRSTISCNRGFVMRRIVVAFTLLISMFGFASASTLSDVKARGKLLCGVNAGLQGFAAKGADGVWAGFDVDYCKALAAAVLGDAAKVEFIGLSAQERFDKLKSGTIDILARNTTWTMERETKFPFLFAGTSYYDGQGFMVAKLSGVTSVFNMSQAAICFVNGTTTQANVDDFFKGRDMTYTAKNFDKPEDALAAYGRGDCDAYTADQSQLYALRLKLAKPGDHIVLPDVISKEPLGPAIRAGDDQWYTIARWTLFALINAEELELRGAGVVDAKSKAKSPAVRRLIGLEGTFGVDMGLDAEWAARAIAAGGNYGEIFDRNLGENTDLKIARGLNALWNKGGIQYAPPVR